MLGRFGNYLYFCSDLKLFDMKRLLISFVCLLGCIQLSANPVTAEQARQKADKFLSGRIANKARARAPQSTDLQMASVGEDDSYYIFNVGQDEGFVIVSGEDATEEILGYSDEGQIDPKNMAPAMKAWMKSYSNYVSSMRKTGVKASTRSSFSEKFQLQGARLARYDQSKPFYNRCPVVDKGFLGFGKDIALTGCVATAMVQLMYYHVWPLEVIRPIPGYTSRRNKLTVDPVEKGTRLNWANTLGYYNYDNQTMWDYVFGTNYPKPTEEQEDNIANIMLYAGTAVNMDYDDDVSLAGARSIPYAMQEYFGYQEGAIYVSKDDLKIDDWLSDIYTELTENGPVIYRAADEEGNGHVFLCEGIDHDMLYLNWGWNNDDNPNNGWFWVTPTTDEQKAKMAFYENQGAVFNLKPDKDKVFKEAKQRISLLGADFSNEVRSWKRQNSQNDFEGISIKSKVLNCIPFPVAYDYGIALFKGDEIVGTPDLSLHYSEGTTFDKPVVDETSYSIGKGVPDGNYTLCFVSRKVDTNEVYKADGTEIFTIAVNIKDNIMSTGEAVIEDDHLQVGDTFTANTVEGVSVLYKVLNKNPWQVEVSCTEDYDAGIDMSTQGPVTIPQTVNGYTVVGVGSSAFSRCKSITKVTLPKTVTYLGSNAFSSCSALESIEGLDAVTSIGRLAICYCKSLKSLKLPETLTFIGAQGLRDNPLLTSLYIPKSVTEIEDNFVLAGDNGLVSIQVDPENKFYNSADDCNAIIETATNKLIAGCATTRIPNTVTAIAAGAFNGLTSLVEITIPASVRDFGYLAFEDCINLEKIYSLSTDPFAFSEKVFKCYNDEDRIYNKAFLYIPKGTKDTYRNTQGWKKFTKMVDASENKSKKGDMNGDKLINVIDIVKIIDLINSGQYDPSADFDGDNKITWADLEAATSGSMKQRVPYSKYAVDLGLSVKWAMMNVGAINPEDYGGYYAWAETTEKSTYSWNNYKYSDATGDKISKYSLSSYYGTVDDLSTVQPMDDAARVNMGKDWRMPTKEEMDELVKKCTWKKEKLNGVNGYRVTGPNGKSIFMPFGGNKSDDDHYNKGSVGYYWVSTLSSTQAAPALYMYSDKKDYMNYTRDIGQSIRPVLRKVDEMDDERMADIIPDEMREGLKDHMPIYNGINPPSIEGAYLVKPYTTVYCEDGHYSVGQVIDSYKIKFLNQNFINNTIDMQEHDIDSSTNDYSIGSGAFISGNGDYFTAFFATEGYARGIFNKMAVVVSGRKTSEGIKDFYYGLLMVDKGDDPDHKLMDVGYFRIFKDGDGLSDPTIWNLNIGARSLSPEENDGRGTMVDGIGVKLR